MSAGEFADRVVEYVCDCIDKDCYWKFPREDVVQKVVTKLLAYHQEMTSKMKPTDQNRLGALIDKMETATTDGNVRMLTQDDIGDIYSWLMWTMNQGWGTTQELCECGQPKNSIRHAFAMASSVDAHEFKPSKD